MKRLPISNPILTAIEKERFMLHCYEIFTPAQCWGEVLKPKMQKEAIRKCVHQFKWSYQDGALYYAHSSNGLKPRGPHDTEESYVNVERWRNVGLKISANSLCCNYHDNERKKIFVRDETTPSPTVKHFIDEWESFAKSLKQSGNIYFLHPSVEQEIDEKLNYAAERKEEDLFDIICENDAHLIMLYLPYNITYYLYHRVGDIIYVVSAGRNGIILGDIAYRIEDGNVLVNRHQAFPFSAEVSDFGKEDDTFLSKTMLLTSTLMYLLDNIRLYSREVGYLGACAYTSTNFFQNNTHLTIKHYSYEQ